MKPVITIVSLLIFCAGCTQPTDSNPAADPAFIVSGFDDAVAWTSESFDADANKFTFAVHSDLTGGERDGVYEVAIAQLNLLRPEFIINVGDLIDGDTDEAVVNEQWDWFDERAGRARAPVFYVAGNHDRTGPLAQSIWNQRQGRAYYHFRYKDVLFLVLDTEDNTPERVAEIHAMRQDALELMAEGGMAAAVDSEYGRLPERQAGNITEAQAQYMIDAINANADVRWTFLFMHKTPWLREEQTTFPAIEAALADRPYTVFHGHFHTYAYQQRNGNDYIRLATTGGGQPPRGGRSMDHVTLVTVDDDGVDIANLLMEGILDKTGQIPLDGAELCFESARCENSP